VITSTQIFGLPHPNFKEIHRPSLWAGNPSGGSSTSGLPVRAPRRAGWPRPTRWSSTATIRRRGLQVELLRQLLQVPRAS
jgi:hypothetical protein